jgi:hypothetical protein
VKQIIKSFTINENTYVEVDNKYGDVEVEIWKKDSIRFEIEITAFSDDETELDEMLGAIHVDLKASSSFIIVQTNWSNDVGIFKKEFLKINQKVSNNARYAINYKISIPDGIDLDIKNSFGNIFLSNYSGKLEIDLAYGDLRAHKISNLKQMKVKSGKVKIKELDYGRVIINGVKPFDLTRGKDIILESTSSDIRIEEIDKLTLKSNHDDIIIEKVIEFSNHSSMSDIRIGELYSKVNSLSKYGSFTIKNISSSSERINLDGYKTDFDLAYDFDFNFNLNLEINEKGNLTYDESVTVNSIEKESNEIFRMLGFIHVKGEKELTIKCIEAYIQLSEN